jgi:CDI toxin RNase A-like protein
MPVSVLLGAAALVWLAGVWLSGGTAEVDSPRSPVVVPVVSTVPSVGSDDQNAAAGGTPKSPGASHPQGNSDSSGSTGGSNNSGSGSAPKPAPAQHPQGSDSGGNGSGTDTPHARPASSQESADQGGQGQGGQGGQTQTRAPASHQPPPGDNGGGNGGDGAKPPPGQKQPAPSEGQGGEQGGTPRPVKPGARSGDQGSDQSTGQVHTVGLTQRPQPGDGTTLGAQPAPQKPGQPQRPNPDCPTGCGGAPAVPAAPAPVPSSVSGGSSAGGVGAGGAAPGSDGNELLDSVIRPGQQLGSQQPAGQVNKNKDPRSGLDPPAGNPAPFPNALPQKPTGDDDTKALASLLAPHPKGDQPSDSGDPSQLPIKLLSSPASTSEGTPAATPAPPPNLPTGAKQAQPGSQPETGYRRVIVDGQPLDMPETSFNVAQTGNWDSPVRPINGKEMVGTCTSGGVSCVAHSMDGSNQDIPFERADPDETVPRAMDRLMANRDMAQYLGQDVDTPKASAVQQHRADTEAAARRVEKGGDVLGDIATVLPLGRGLKLGELGAEGLVKGVAAGWKGLKGLFSKEASEAGAAGAAPRAVPRPGEPAAPETAPAPKQDPPAGSPGKAPETAVPKPPEEDPPSSPLAPDGGLQAHENAGGHTLNPNKAHVGASEQQLRDRLANDPNHPSAVSSFYDRAAAERSAHENIAGNENGIDAWLSSGASQPKAFDWHHGQPVGRRVDGHSPQVVNDVSGSRVVLKKDPSMPSGYKILTSFPIP